MNTIYKPLLESSWGNLLQDYMHSNRGAELDKKISEKYQIESVHPPKLELFSALTSTEPDTISVVILGQDPYHQAGQAHGLAFSVVANNKIPPSLRNIYKELSSDYSIDTSGRDGDLTHWARQGVLLLNTSLSVQDSQPGSHEKLGWSEFTEHILQKISETRSGVIFILWGNHAQSKAHLIDTKKHHLIQSSHPSPLSARHSFFGSKPFSRTNKLLKAQNKKEIIW